MAQHDYVIANGTGAAVRSDLNNGLSAIVTQNSGATEPATTYAFMRWADTTAGVMKMRNSANNAWITLYQLDGEWTNIAFENGTAAAPSIYFKDSGTDTGFYSPGANQVGISTGGTARLTIDSNGNVDIDSNTLYVDATNNRVGLGTSSVVSKFQISNSGAEGYEFNPGDAANVNATFHYNRTSSAWIANRIGASYHRFDVSGSESMRLTSTGLGIGTATPQVFSGYTTVTIDNATNGGVLCINKNAVNIGNISGTNDALTLDGAGGGSSPIVFRTGAATTERARIDSSGRLLVGTSSARSFVGTERLVQIEGTSGSTTNLSITRNSNDSGSGNLFLGKSRGTANGSNTIVQSGDGLGGVYFNGTDGTQFVTGAFIACEVDGTPGANDMPGRLVFSTTADGASGSTERVRIANNGNFYIGGGTSFGASGWTTQNAGCQVSQYSPTSDTRTLYQWQSDNAGTNTTAVYIESTGKIYARTTTVQAIASERRLKENIAPVDQTESWSTVRDLPYYKYNFIGSDPTNVVYGPIADEVPDEMRVATSQSDDVGVIHTYDNAMLQARSFVALQAALKRIETLEAKVAALEGA